MLTVPHGGSMVLLRSHDGALDRPGMAQRLAAVADVPFYDAMNLLGRHRGQVLAENLDPAVAQRWLEELAAMGLPAVVLPQPDLIFVGNAMRVEYSASQFSATVEHAALPVECGWEAIVALGAGQVDHVQDRPLGGEVSSKTVLKSLMVELFTTVRGQVITLNAQHLTYTHLGARMGSSSTDNMRLTVRDIVDHAPRAVRTAAVDKLMQGCLLHDIHCGDEQALRDETMWALHSARPGGSGEHGESGGRFSSLEL